MRFNVLLFIWYDTIRYTTQHNIHCVLTETERTNLYWRLNWTQPTKLLHIRCIVYYILYTRIYVYQTNRRPMILKYILHFVSVYFSTPASSVECSSANVFNIIFANTIFHSLAAQLCIYYVHISVFLSYRTYRCINMYI